MSTLFTVLHIIMCVLLIVVVLLQEGKDPGMKGGIAGASADMGDSFFNKNTGRTKAAMFSKMTAVLSVLFLITTVALDGIWQNKVMPKESSGTQERTKTQQLYFI